MKGKSQLKYPGIIAIDGPAASGKSTLAEKLADFLGYLYFDTGVMYRAVTLAALQSWIKVEDENQVSYLANRIQIDVFPASSEDGRKYDVQLNGQDVTWDIRSTDVDAKVSIVSSYPEVRAAMTEQQRRIGKRGNTVMVGRDIGTVVFPEAGIKIYLDASLEERSRRRHNEVTPINSDTSLEEILTSLQNRDKIDSTRSIAPLKPAEDALIINTDNLSQDEVFETVLAILKLK